MKKLLVFVVFLISVAIAIAVQNPGHSASHIDPGTFPAGNYSLQPGYGLYWGNPANSNQHINEYLGDLWIGKASPGAWLKLDKNGNVGINTANPAHKLDVNGNSSFADTIYLLGGLAGMLSWDNLFNTELIAAPGKLVRIRGGPAETDDLIVDSTGKVGIGTHTPAEKLEVVGGVKANSVKSSEICLSGDCRTSWPAATAAAGGGYWNSSGSYLYPSSTSYKVGIGTTSPDRKFSVNGTADFWVGTTASNPETVLMGGGAGYASVSAARVNTWTNTDLRLGSQTGNGVTVMTLTSGGYVGIGMTSPRGLLDIGNYRQLIFNSNGGSGVYGEHIGFNADLNTGVVPNQFIKLAGGTATAGGQRGGAAIVTDYIGNMYFQMYDAGVGYETTERTTSYAPQITFTNTGNVGIGTTSPSYKLQVGGDTGNNNVYVGGHDVSLYLEDTTPSAGGGFTSKYRLSMGQATDGLFEIRDATSSDTSANTRLAINHAGNVGIGTTSPGSYKLNVAGNIAWGTNGANFNEPASYTSEWTGGSSQYLGLRPTRTDYGVLIWDSARNYYLNQINLDSTTFGWFVNQASSGSGMVLTSSGNVGIGTTNPGAKLEVAGGGGYYAQNSWYRGIRMANAAAIFWAGGSNSFSIGQSGNTLYFGRATSETGGVGTQSYPMYIDSSGQVTISTLCLSGVCLGAWPAGAAAGATLPSGTSGQTLRNDGTNWVANSVLFNDGTNIGIGTPPGYKLDVNGDARISNTLGVGMSPISNYGISSSGSSAGVYGISDSGTGIMGGANSGVGVKGVAYYVGGIGVYGYSVYGAAYNSYAGYFNGDVKIAGGGTLSGVKIQIDRKDCYVSKQEGSYDAGVSGGYGNGNSEELSADCMELSDGTATSDYVAVGYRPFEHIYQDNHYTILCCKLKIVPA